MINGLAQVLQAQQVSNLAKARWLQKPHPLFGGSTPLDLLRQGRLEDLLAEAGQLGRGQD
ncbi:MAG: antitoxin Xre/MbcA/ParS toxin-binding domain-containing protein [Synechococcaceae cyanobacterium]